MILVRVVEEVSRADGAAGWCLALGGEFGGLAPYGLRRPGLLFAISPEAKAYAFCDYMQSDYDEPGKLR